jgi:hypothetical protein
MYPFRLRAGGVGGELLAGFRRPRAEPLPPPPPPAGGLAAAATEEEGGAAAAAAARVEAAGTIGDVTGGGGDGDQGDMAVLLGTCRCLGLGWVVVVGGGGEEWGTACNKLEAGVE